MKSNINQKKNGNSKLPIKRKVNKKKLVLIFLGTFGVFFALAIVIATQISPKLDVPALKEEEENFNTVTSDDFKGRLDPALRAIEMQEQFSPVVGGNSANSQNNTTQNAQTQTTSKQQTTAENTETLPYDIRNEDVNEVQTSQNIERPIKPEVNTSPTYQPEPAPQPEPPSSPVLRDKIKLEKESSALTKVMIGSYSTPTEAKKASQELSSSNLNVTPFIKENNGKYSVQVGSFTNSQKADNLVNELKKRNYQTRIVQE